MVPVVILSVVHSLHPLSCLSYTGNTLMIAVIIMFCMHVIQDTMIAWILSGNDDVDL